MSGRIIPTAPTGHDCRNQQPWRSGGYGSTGHPDGTLWVCDCGIAYIARPCYESYGPTQKWHRVHWWNFEARRRLSDKRVVPRD